MGFFNCFKRIPSLTVDLDINQTYHGAGIIFTNYTHMLAGYQPYKTIPCISGIGGSKENIDTNHYMTALREWIEEIFGFTYDHAMELMIKDMMQYKELQVFQVKDGNYIYVNIVYSLEVLPKFLLIVERHAKEESPYYTVFPYTLSELILNRKTCKSQEVSHLTLLPVVQEKFSLTPSVQKDIQYLTRTPSYPSFLYKSRIKSNI